MAYLPVIREEFKGVLAEFEQSPPMRRLASGKVTVEHYKAYLRQIFHHTRENPQLQALATVYFRGQQRSVIRKFYHHASSEIGHDQLALRDLATLTSDTYVRDIPFENPLPATMALISFGFYQIYNLNPVGYLGYLFFLEFTPTQRAAKYMELLQSQNIPASAMTFLHDHGTIDVAHNKMMESYVDVLVTDQRELESVLYAMKVTGSLYAGMIEAAFEQADNPKDYGVSDQESHFSEAFECSR